MADPTPSTLSLAGLEPDAPPTAAVAIPVPVSMLYHYAVPPRLAERAVVGARVKVPFGPRTQVGYIVERDTPPPPDIKLRPLGDVLDGHLPTYEPSMVAFLRWLADYYHAPIGEVMRAAHPAGTNIRGLPALAITEAGRATLAADDPEVGDALGVLLRLATATGPLPLAAINAAPSVIRRWVGRGWVERAEIIAGPRVETRTVPAYKAIAPAPVEPRGRGGKHLKRDQMHAWLVGRGWVRLADLKAQFSPHQPHLGKLIEEDAIAVKQVEHIRDPFFGEAVDRDTPPKLTAGQTKAVERIDAAEGFTGFLLHGITGSGKTEVYLRCIEAALARGQGALVLVPEIALTPQLVRRFRARLGDQLAVLHSGLGEGARFDQWRRLRRGDVKLAIGARSAVFAPVADLGLIVVDEEHDPSYKQGDGVRYHGRDMALLRGQRAGARVVLGSATPSLESCHNVAEGKLTRLALIARPTGGRLPEVELIDLNTTPRPEDGVDFLSEPLRAAIGAALAREEQSIIFLNRRGFSTFAQCGNCGEVVECDQCAIAMTWHKGRRHLRCHYCDATRPLPERCGVCHHKEIKLPGRGTERVEESLQALFPQARIARLDRDTATGKRMQEILGQMRHRQLDILVGTQMVTKGHDFPYVTLVGVLDADAGLHFPDFRAAERAFQLLAQVAGRAGRGDRAGRVIVQTRSPQHVCLQASIKHDHAQLVTAEMGERRAYGWPPYSHAAALRFEGRDADRVATLAGHTADLLRRSGVGQNGTMLRGPTLATIERIRGRTRWMLLITSTRRGPLHRLLRVIDEAALPRAGDPKVIVDVDPYDLM